MVVFGQTLLYLDKGCCILAKWSYLDKIVVFEQQWSDVEKMVVFGQALLFLDKGCCI